MMIGAMRSRRPLKKLRELSFCMKYLVQSPERTENDHMTI